MVKDLDEARYIILEGLVGSHAYGLATPTSDQDIKGIYVAPTEQVLGLYHVRDVYDNTDPDYAYYEAGKFLRMALKCNPSILELLFLEGYTQQTKLGHSLVDNRHIFLSNRVKSSYGGYAISQARKLHARAGDSFSSSTKNRKPKHARHCFRLLWQGRELLETGTLTVRVTQSQRDELFALGEMPVEELVRAFEDEYKRYQAIESVLPDEPDMERANKLLLKIRRGN